MEEASSKEEVEPVHSEVAAGRVSAKKSTGKGSVAAKKPESVAKPSRPSTAKKAEVKKEVIQEVPEVVVQKVEEILELREVVPAK